MDNVRNVDKRFYSFSTGYPFGHKALRWDDVTSEPVIRYIRIRYIDLVNEDKFLRFWVLILNIDDPIPSPVNEGHLSKVFVDTGASCNR
jgi:hypothetical protein